MDRNPPQGPHGDQEKSVPIVILRHGLDLTVDYVGTFGNGMRELHWFICRFLPLAAETSPKLLALDASVTAGRPGLWYGSVYAGVADVNDVGFPSTRTDMHQIHGIGLFICSGRKLKQKSKGSLADTLKHSRHTRRI